MRTARWVRDHDAASRVLVLANQTPGILDRVGLTREQVDRDAWAIEPSGRTYVGAAAINRVLGELGPFWSALGSAYQVWPVRWLEDRGYRWIAMNRPLFARFGDVPECEQPGAHC